MTHVMHSDLLLCRKLYGYGTTAMVACAYFAYSINQGGDEEEEAVPVVPAVVVVVHKAH
jgi:hypothetical protein